MLTDLTLAAAAEGLRARRFTARELAQAHLDGIAALNERLNAYITVTPDQALAQADAADAALAAGTAGPLAGIPLAIKDLFCTAGVRTTAASRILSPFVPPYESTVTAHLLRDGAVFLGKTEPGRVRHGLVQHDQRLRPGDQPVDARGRRAAGARRVVRRVGGGGGGRDRDGRDRDGHGRLDPPARGRSAALPG